MALQGFVLGGVLIQNRAIPISFFDTEKFKLEVGLLVSDFPGDWTIFE